MADGDVASSADAPTAPPPALASAADAGAPTHAVEKPEALSPAELIAQRRRAAGWILVRRLKTMPQFVMNPKQVELIEQAAIDNRRAADDKERRKQQREAQAPPPRKAPQRKGFVLREIGDD